MGHQLRLKITNKYTRTVANHIKRGDLTNYSTDDEYIYKNITDAEYSSAIINGNNEPFMMDEIGLVCEYNFNYKK
jgi:hypothetical protein